MKSLLQVIAIFIMIMVSIFILGLIETISSIDSTDGGVGSALLIITTVFAFVLSIIIVMLIKIYHKLK